MDAVAERCCLESGCYNSLFGLAAKKKRTIKGTSIIFYDKDT
jgi:hypothetical protein